MRSLDRAAKPFLGRTDISISQAEGSRGKRISREQGLVVTTRKKELQGAVDATPVPKRRRRDGLRGQWRGHYQEAVAFPLTPL